MIDAAIASLRLDYQQATLLEADVDSNPFVQFTAWWQQVLAAKIEEPNAMAVSTVNDLGHPQSRIVLLKSFSEKGFIFFTNYDSAKGKNIANNPNVSLLFFWKELERQVRINGIATKIPAADSTIYFNSRPASSQLGAIASIQSSILPNRQTLDNQLAEITKVYNSTQQITKPENWGGYNVVPHTIEFWQGRTSRLHDRLQYSLQIDTTWQLDRLSP
jgi:pyridoxamine 5'-phosphate oxidase